MSWPVIRGRRGLCAKSDLDTRVDGRHQGVVAVLHAGVQHEAAGMISEADLMERVADAPSPLLLILGRCDGPT